MASIPSYLPLNEPNYLLYQYFSSFPVYVMNKSIVIRLSRPNDRR